jgi:antitoxin ParD1/3/4
MTASGEPGNQLEEFVANLVASGWYSSKRKVLREGARLIQEREARLADLDAKPAAEVFNRLEAKYRARAEAKGS